MTARVQTRGGTVNSYSYTSTLIVYSDLFPKAEIGYRSVKGNLYYVGFINEELDDSRYYQLTCNLPTL